MTTDQTTGGRCPDCSVRPTRYVHVDGGWSNIEHPEGAIDWDQWALCESCHTCWQTGHLCADPKSAADVIEDWEFLGSLEYRGGGTVYRMVVPVNPYPGSAEEYFANGLRNYLARQ